MLQFAQRIVSKIAVGFTELEGKIFEQILCDMYRIPWRGSNNGLTDVIIPGDRRVGFTVKSLQFDRKAVAGTVRTIIGRCSPDTFDGTHIEKNVTDPSEAGRKVIAIWNSRLNEAKSQCDEFRQLTFLKSKNLRRWVVFEFEPVAFDSDDFVWQWGKAPQHGKKRKGVNLYGESNDGTGLTWQPNGSQFSLTMKIPSLRFEFSLPSVIPVIQESRVLSEIGYDENWVRLH